MSAEIVDIPESTQPPQIAFRRYPKNTWRLVKLRERYLALRFKEESELPLQNPLYTKSEYELRNTLMNNIGTLDSHSKYGHIDDRYSVTSSSVPSLTSRGSTSSPTSLRSRCYQENEYLVQMTSQTSK